MRTPNFPSNRLRDQFDGQYDSFEEINLDSIRSRTVLAVKGRTVRYVVKFLHSNHETRENELRLQREYRALSDIGPAAVPRVVRDGTAYPHPYFVTEFVEGFTFAGLMNPDLRSQLLRSKLRRPGALAHLQTMFGHALATGHSAGYLHGDVAPGNVMVKCRFGEIIGVCLLDFGECERLKPNGIYVRAAGTEGFVPRDKYVGAPVNPAHDFESLSRCVAALADALGVRAPEPYGGPK